MPSPRRLAGAGALLAAVAIAAGAFGAHAARDAQAAEWLRTAGLYALVHGAAGTALAERHPRATMLLLVGAAWFAATLVVLALGGPRWLGALTPIGGVAMIVGWLAIAYVRVAAPRRQRSEQ